MQNRERLHGLYVLTDENLTPPDCLIQSVEQAIAGGCRIIQYRDKTSTSAIRLKQARSLRTLCANSNALLIINDDIELAIAVDADGVHLGEHDEDISSARRQLGERLIGISCYNDMQRARQAQQHGADYIAFGSFFQSSTKPDARPADVSLLTHAKQSLDIPVVAIGGITLGNAASLIEAGADMLAVITDVFASHDIASTAYHFTQLFDSYKNG